MGILNFLKAPFASEGSVFAEYHFLLLPRYWGLLEDTFSSGFEKEQEFVRLQVLSGHQTSSSVNIW